MPTKKPRNSTTKPLKIGFVLDDTLDTADGVQQYVLTVSTWLKAQGHEVHYLVGQTARTDLEHIHSLARNVAVRFNKNRMSIPLPASKPALRQLLEREKFDVLHVQLPYSPMLAGRIIASAPAQTAIVGTFHVAPYSLLVSLGNHLLHVLNRRSIRRFDNIMSVSSVAQQFARKTIKQDTSIVPNTVDLGPYAAAKPLKRYNDGVTTVLFLGRLVERKGCWHLLRAVRILRDERLVKKPFRVVICGKGQLETPLKRYVAEHQLESIVDFAGFVAEEDKPAYMSAADVAVFPSTGGESFGIVLIEAMAAAKGAVLAGNNPGYASVARPEALFDPHNERQLANMLAEHINSPSLRAQYHAQQQIMVKQYDVATVGRQIEDCYIAALHSRRK